MDNQQTALMEFEETFNSVYKMLYDCDDFLDYRRAVDLFDWKIKHYQEFKQQVIEFNKLRGDFIASDRESAAYIITARMAGLL